MTQAVTSRNLSCPVAGEYQATSRDGCVHRVSVGCQHATYIDINLDCTTHSAAGHTAFAVTLKCVHTYRVCGSRQNAERGGSAGRRTPLVSFNHVIDPHFVAFSISLYTTIRNPNPNPNRNHTVVTDSQIGSRDTQIVTVPPRSAFCRVSVFVLVLKRC